MASETDTVSLVCTDSPVGLVCSESPVSLACAEPPVSLVFSPVIEPLKQSKISQPFENNKVRKYINPGGNFITGIEFNSKDSDEKRGKRLQRFGHTLPQTPSEVSFSLDKLQDRAKRFGGTVPVIDGEVIKCLKKLPKIPEGTLREEAVFLYGTNEMNTKDVLNYFALYGPSYLEWIDDTSCNAVWEDPSSACRALYGKGQFPVLSDNEVDIDTVTPVWRLGEPHPKAQQLLLRSATTGDIKKPGAASKSRYYQLHGNPNRINKKRKEKMSSKEVISGESKFVENELISDNLEKTDLRSKLNLHLSQKSAETGTMKRDTEGTTTEEEIENEPMEIGNEAMDIGTEAVEIRNEALEIRNEGTEHVVTNPVNDDILKCHGGMRSDSINNTNSSNDLRNKLSSNKISIKSRLG